MRLGVLAAAALVVGGCSSSGSGSGSGNSGPATGKVDQSALLFGLVYGNATLVGTQPSDSVQVFNSGTGTVTISGATIGTGPDTLTQTLPVGAMGAPVMQTFTADTTHSDFFTASAPSASSVSGSDASVIQVIFNPTEPGIFSATLNIATSTGTLSVLLGGEAVSPLIATAGGTTAFTVPQVTLVPEVADDGGTVAAADGGLAYQTGYSSTIIPLFNPGSATLNINPATESDNGETWQLCRVEGAASTCTLTAGSAFPANLVAGYSDGGLAVGPGTDGGTVILSADQKVYFSPSVPGTYTNTITITSNATNTPSLVLTVTGTAVAGP